MCAAANTEIVKALLNADVDVNLRDRYGETTLMIATQYGHTDAVNALLEKGADVNLQNNTGSTALMIATQYGHTDAVNALIEKGADVNLQNKDGSTALIWAAQGAHTEIVKALLNAGADVNLKNQDGDTALRYGNRDIIKLLGLHEKYQKICTNVAKKSKGRIFKDFSFAENLEHGKEQLDSYLNTHKNLSDTGQRTESIEDKIKAYAQIKWRTSFLYKALRFFTAYLYDREIHKRKEQSENLQGKNERPTPPVISDARNPSASNNDTTSIRSSLSNPNSVRYKNERPLNKITKNNNR
jgi:hypothetical protein